MNMNIANVRVSTIEQNEDRQIEALKKYYIERWYIDKFSGKDMSRPKLQEMLSYIREGDTVFIHELLPGPAGTGHGPGCGWDSLHRSTRLPGYSPGGSGWTAHRP